MKGLDTTGELTENEVGHLLSDSVIRVRDGYAGPHQWPLLEAKELLGGYCLVDVASRNHALELAAMIPDARSTAWASRSAK